VTRLGDRLYVVYGDLVFARPRVGVIKEFDLELRPTGRSVGLMRHGKPLLIHPTGLTRHEPWGTFLGDTVLQKARIYRLDWEQAWKDGNLDRAVLGEVDDDAAINGTRPVFVSLGGKTYLATADYGDVHPEIRLYDRVGESSQSFKVVLPDVNVPLSEHRQRFVAEQVRSGRFPSEAAILEKALALL
jgi:hypothetical protein